MMVPSVHLLDVLRITAQPPTKIFANERRFGDAKIVISTLSGNKREEKPPHSFHIMVHPLASFLAS
jgi:hypothetical protein